MNRLGINQGTSGNLSVRIAEGFLITPSGLAYDKTRPEDMVQMGLDGVSRGRRRPSSEWRFHRDIYCARPDVGVVLHAHAPYATVLAVQQRGLPAFHYMVALAGGDDIRCAPYATFGTQALSDHVLAALQDRNACLLAHHGLIVTARTVARALALALEVETLARQYVHALAIGPVATLSSAAMAQVHAQIRALNYGHNPDRAPPGGEV